MKKINLLKNIFILNYFCFGYLLIYSTLFFINIFFNEFKISIISVLILVLLLNILYWFKLKNNLIHIKNFYSSRYIFIIIFFICPLFIIIQEPYLIVDRLISKITLLIVTVFALIYLIIERKNFLHKTIEMDSN